MAVGANGIAVVGDKVYVANTNTAKLLQIPINSDGAAGKPIEYITSNTTCAPLRGADGMAADDDGSLFIAADSANALVRVDRGGQVTSTFLDNSHQLDYPTSVALATVDGRRYAFITNLALTTKAQPGLLSYGPLP
jgi:sugar lactone lactonase YvrE